MEDVLGALSGIGFLLLAGYTVFRHRKQIVEGLKFFVPVFCVLTIALAMVLLSMRLTATLSVGVELSILKVAISVCIGFFAFKCLEWLIPIVWNSMGNWHKR